MNKGSKGKHLFISVKPEFANKIISQKKKIELRKVKPSVEVGSYVIIYASSPIKSILGFGVVQEIIETTPKQMWKKYSSMLGIDKIRFDDYYNGTEKAIGIKIKNTKQIPPIHLKDLRNDTPNFHPPQIYRYASKLIEQGKDKKGNFIKIYF